MRTVARSGLEWRAIGEAVAETATSEPGWYGRRCEGGTRPPGLKPRGSIPFACVTPAPGEAPFVRESKGAYRATPIASAFQRMGGRTGAGAAPATRVLVATYARGTAK